MSRMPKVLQMCVAAALLLHAEPARAADPTFHTIFDSLSGERMVADVRTLSAPSLNGRQAGTDDDVRSAQWVAQEFLSAGLRLPSVSNGALTFPFTSGESGTPLGVMASVIPASLISPEPLLRIGAADRLYTAGLGPDYLPIFDSPSALSLIHI